MLKAADGDFRYTQLPTIIKSALILGQANAEAKRSLSINKRIVTKEKTWLGETTINGLHLAKELVRFFDPVNKCPENVPITNALRKYVGKASSAYEIRLEKEKEAHKAERERAQEQKEISAKLEQEKKQLLQKKKDLKEDEEHLLEDEEKAKVDIEAADLLSQQANKKLQEALSMKPLNKEAITMANMMLETANKKRKAAMEDLNTVMKKQKSIQKSTHKLLDKALPTESSTGKHAKGKNKNKK